MPGNSAQTRRASLASWSSVVASSRRIPPAREGPSSAVRPHKLDRGRPPGHGREATAVVGPLRTASGGPGEGGAGPWMGTPAAGVSLAPRNSAPETRGASPLLSWRRPPARRRWCWPESGLIPSPARTTRRSQAPLLPATDLRLLSPSPYGARRDSPGEGENPPHPLRRRVSLGSGDHGSLSVASFPPPCPSPAPRPPPSRAGDAPRTSARLPGMGRGPPPPETDRPPTFAWSARAGSLPSIVLLRDSPPHGSVVRSC